MNATQRRSARLLLILAISSFVWVFLMSSLPNRRGIAANETPKDDPSMTAAIAAIDRQQFPKINLSLRIADANGDVLRDLVPTQFRVYEDGKPVSVANFASAGHQTISVYLVIDHSGSMAGPKLPGAKNAALAMMKLMRDGADRLGVVEFDDGFNEIVPMGLISEDQRSQAEAAIERIHVGSGTHFYAALEQTLKRMEDVPGRRILLALTDGEDTEGGFGGFFRNSNARIAKIAERAKELDVPIYTVGLGGRGAFDETVLRTIAKQSGGEFLQTADPTELATIYQRIGTALQNEYGLSYTSPYPADGLMRKVEVVINRNGSGKVAQESYPTIGVGPQRLAANSDPAADAASSGSGQPQADQGSPTAPTSAPTGSGAPIFSVFLPIFFPLMLMMLIPYSRTYLRGGASPWSKLPTLASIANLRSNPRFGANLAKTPPPPPTSSSASHSSSYPSTPPPNSSPSSSPPPPPSVAFNPVPTSKPSVGPSSGVKLPSSTSASSSTSVAAPPTRVASPNASASNSGATAPRAANACPRCGKTSPGSPGLRYCVVCEDHF